MAILNAAFQGGHDMDAHAFEAELSKNGFTQIETKAIEPRPANTAHAHDYVVRGLVLDGIFIVAENGKPTTYLPGDIFQVAQGQPHTEEIGAGGARVLVGRKY
jgi:quercetin dioxygenase-like cupin family protein